MSISPSVGAISKYLAEIKLWTNDLEASFGEAGAAPGLSVPRPINLDPGFIELSKLVLATTKDHAHRIYLGRVGHAYGAEAEQMDTDAVKLVDGLFHVGILILHEAGGRG